MAGAACSPLETHFGPQMLQEPNPNPTPNPNPDRNPHPNRNRNRNRNPNPTPTALTLTLTRTRQPAERGHAAPALVRARLEGVQRLTAVCQPLDRLSQLHVQVD